MSGGKREPAAWRYAHKGIGDWHVQKDDPRAWLATFSSEYDVEPLYATPPSQSAMKVVEEKIETIVKLAISDGEYIGRHLNSYTPEQIIDLRRGVTEERLKAARAALNKSNP